MNRESKNQAQKIIEKLYPEKEARNAYLKMFSEAIAEARKHGEEKWGVTLHQDRIRLIIGQPVVCTLHIGYMWFVLPGEAYPDYILPVGVWQVRENCRNAMRNTPKMYETFNEAINYIMKRLSIPLEKWIESGPLLRQTMTQRKLTDFFN